MPVRFLIVSLFIFSFPHTIQAQNYSMLFDGFDDKVTVPHNNAYNLGTGDFTFEAMVNIPSGNTVNMPILSKRTTSFDGFLFLSTGGGSYLILQMNGVPNEVSAMFPNIRDNNCHHVAVKRSGATGQFYVDGIAAGGFSFTHGGINSTGPINIGYDFIDDNSLDGSISEIRFWSVARSQADIQTYMNSPVPNNSTGLIGLWRFNEGNGESVVDSSATKNNGYMGSSNTTDIEDPIRNAVCTTGDLINSMAETKHKAKISMAPNPFTEETTLWLETPSKEYSIQVYNIQGLLVSTYTVNTKNHIQLGQDLPKGIYFVNVIDGDVSHALKMIKE